MAKNKRSKIDLVEERYGKPLRVVLIDMFNQHGNINTVAEVLGVSQSTISGWLIRCGLSIKSVVVTRESA
jgi:predicted transcriptional regulator